MKRRWNKVLSIALVVSFLLTGCMGPKPDKVVESFLQAFQSGDFAAATQYLTTGEDVTFIESKSDTAVNAIMTAVEYENINLKSKDKDEAIVTATITALDTVSIMNSVMREAIPLAFAYAFSDDSSASEDYDRMLDQMMNNALLATDAPKVKTTVTFVLKKTENGWKIDPTTELFDGLTGGLFTYAGGSSEKESNEEEERVEENNTEPKEQIKESNVIGEEQAKANLLNALAIMYPEYAGYDYEFYDNGEDDMYYSYQAFLAEDLGYANNNMGFYDVDKYTGVVYNYDVVADEMVEIYVP